MKRTGRKQTGFTIIELMMATAVFSMVLLVCTFGILEIGRSYYKGAAINRSQEVARTIMEEVADTIRFQHGDVVVDPGASLCIGAIEYEYDLDAYYDDAAGDPNPLIRRNVDNCGPPSVASPNPDEAGLLGSRMRLQKFTVESVPGTANEGLYKIIIRVATGEDEYLDGTGQCKNERLASQFCAVTELETIVLRRV